MKVIIIEGPDNSGKNTLIYHILETYKRVKIIHCDKPVSDNPFKEQCELFGNYVLETIKDYKENNADVLVFNRAWYGEYVYGQMYRNGNPESIKRMIQMIETKLFSEIHPNDLYYVQLSSTSIDLLVRNDDKKSLSQANRNNIKKELMLFTDVFNNSHIVKKLLINVNEANNFRIKKDIIRDFEQLDKIEINLLTNEKV